MEDDPEKAERDERLDALKKAYAELYQAETKRVDVEVQFLKDLKARSSAQSLARKNAAVNKLLLIEDINTFLAG